MLLTPGPALRRIGTLKRPPATLIRIPILIRVLTLTLTPILIPTALTLLGCTPKLEHSDPRVRLGAVEDPALVDRAILERLATTDPSAEVRQAALKKLSDPALIARIALADVNDGVCRLAIESIGDPSVLASIAVGHAREAVRLFAVKMLHPQARTAVGTLARVAAESGDEEVRTQASILCHVGFVADQERLAAIAADPSLPPKIRCAAVRRMADEGRLADLLANPEANMDYDTRLAAVQHLSDDALLARIAWEHSDSHVCRAAVDRLKDPAKLASLATLDAAVKAKLLADIEQGRVSLSGLNIQDLRIHAIRRLTEQRPLESIAKDDPDPNIREAAVRRLDSLEIVAAIAEKEAAPGVKWQAELRLEILRRGEAGIANLLLGLFEKAGGGAGWLLRDPSLPESWDLYRAMRAVEHIRDAALLEKLAGEAPHPEIRLSAAEALDDPPALARLVSASEDGKVRQLVAGKIDIDRTDDPAVLRAVARAAYSTERKAAAIARIVDPTARAECVVGRMDPVLRAVALLGVAHDALLWTLAQSEKTPLVRETAILLLEDQEKLRALATDEPRATIRRTAVLGLSDDGFLLKRLELDPSPAVRAAAVRSLRETSSLLAAVQGSYHADVRAAAFSRLGEIKDEVSLAQARAAQEDIVRRAEACRALEDAAALVGSALGGGHDVVCRAAAERLEAPEALLRIACEATDRGVLKVALGKISDRDALAAVSLKAADAAMRLAAEQKAGRRSWEDIFKAAAGDVRALGDSVAAVALFGETLKDAAAAVQQACLDLIRLGDESRIPEMADLLELYGDRTLCEDYLNCEQPDLGAAGSAWAVKRGYTVRSGSGSSRASWGEGR